MANGSTHVVFQGKHYEIPGNLSREEALLRVQNLTSEDLPKMQGGFGDSRELTPEEQAPLTAADEAREGQFRGQQWSEGSPDAQDYTKLLGGAAFAAAPSLGAGIPANVIGRGVTGAEGARQGYESGGVPGAVAGGAFGAAAPPGVTAPTLGAAFGYDVGGVPGAIAGAGTGLLGRGVDLARRIARGAVSGGGAGLTPFVGRGVEKGAQLGIASEFGQGGLGALWKHGKQMDITRYLSRLMGGGPAAEARGAASSLGSAATPRLNEMPGHIARQLEAERALAEASRLARAGGRQQRTARMGEEAAQAFRGPQPQLSPQQVAAAEAAEAARVGRAGMPQPPPLGGRPPAVSAPAAPVAAPAPAPAAVPAPAPAPWPPQSAMTFEGAAQRGGRVPLDAALEAGGAAPARSTFGRAMGSIPPQASSPGLSQEMARRTALEAQGNVLSAGGVAAGTGPVSPLILKVQQAMSQPGGRQAVMEWLKTQPQEIAEQILPLLQQGVSKF